MASSFRRPGTGGTCSFGSPRLGAGILARQAELHPQNYIASAQPAVLLSGFGALEREGLHLASQGSSGDNWIREQVRGFTARGIWEALFGPDPGTTPLTAQDRSHIALLQISDAVYGLREHAGDYRMMDARRFGFDTANFNLSNGLKGAIYSDGTTIVLAFAGTDGLRSPEPMGPLM